MSRRLAAFVSTCLMLAGSSAALAGGGPHNLLLVVNPNDENALRVATAYAQTRDVPDTNIMFIAPPPASASTPLAGSAFAISQQQFKNTYTTPIANAIAARGLSGQIDFIVLAGGSHAITTGLTSPLLQSLNYGLTLLSPINAGLDVIKARTVQPHGADTALFKTNYSSAALFGDPNYYGAIRHNATYNVSYANQGPNGESRIIPTQYYMVATLGYTGFLGLTAPQVISNLTRTIAADGAKLRGTLYFERTVQANGMPTVNSSSRVAQWPAVQTAIDQLRAQNKTQLRWIEEIKYPSDSPVPVAKANIAGAVIGTGVSNLGLPQGSTYQAGAWVDNLTSYGAMFSRRMQTKVTEFLLAGASACAGTVAEPTNITTRWPHAAIHLQSIGGLSLGESFYRAVASPDMTLFIGDPLSQPHADLPEVFMTTRRTGTVLTIDAAATLPANRVLATGIKRYELYVDGKLRHTLPGTGDNGVTFSVDTTQLSDGLHEMRVVAINNAAAESQGYVLQEVTVNNHGRAVQAPAVLVLESTGTQSIPVTVNMGDGSSALAHIEFRAMGRTLGVGGLGVVYIDAGQLAYGGNRLVPVAIFTDGSEVFGASISVTRKKPWLEGQPLTPQPLRRPGVQAEYFMGGGSASGAIPGSTYTGEPDLVAVHHTLTLANPANDNMFGDVDHEFWVTDQVNRLAVRFTARFEVTAAKAGEYTFFFESTNDGAELHIDGRPVLTLYNRFRHTTMEGVTVWLLAGEHTLTLLTNNAIESSPGSNFYDMALLMRDPNGVTVDVNSSFAYH